MRAEFLPLFMLMALTMVGDCVALLLLTYRINKFNFLT